MRNEVKLSRIEINNYRSCVTTIFDPNYHLSALIGPNGSGKTNILSAFQLLPLLLHGGSGMYARRTTVEPFSSDCELKVRFEWRGHVVVYDAQISLINNERNDDEIINSVESWYAYSITGSRKKIKIPLNIMIENYRFSKHRSMHRDISEYISRTYGSEVVGMEMLAALSAIVEYIKSITYYSASIFTNPSSCPISFEVESESGSRRGISITGHKKFLYDLYTAKKLESLEYSQFIELVGPDGVCLIDDLSFQEVETSSSVYKVAVGGRITTKEKKNNLIIPNFLIAGNSLSPSQLSEGTFRALALIFYLITNRGSLLLIEEPEVCVHHGLLSSIVALLKAFSFDKQIVISTHSDQLLDELDVESVFKVSRGENGTSVENVKRSLSAEELKALKEYLCNEGGLGEYWKHGAL